MKLFAILLIVFDLAAQTRVDLVTQAKNIDFSVVPSTRPATVGTTLPTTCTNGQLYFKSNAPPGFNLYGCTSPNSWTSLTASVVQNNGVAPTSGSGSAYVSTTNCPASLAFLQIFDFVPDVTNTVTNPTLNICGLGALPITHNDTTNVGVGELQ
jgi:hypothetical protein